MSAIIRNIVNQAYQLPGIIEQDEVANGTDASIAVIKLNELLNQLNIEQLFPYSVKIVNYVVGVQKQTYTIGLDTLSTADIVEERPCFIQTILYKTNAQACPQEVIQLDISDLLKRSLPTSVGRPDVFAVNPKYPLSDIIFNMQPTAGSIIQIIYNQSIPAVTINSTLDIPPEYNDVLITGLSRKLSVLKQMPQDTLQTVDILWKEAIARVQTNNSRNQIPVMDIFGRDFVGGGEGNIYSFNARIA